MAQQVPKEQSKQAWLVHSRRVTQYTTWSTVVEAAWHLPPHAICMNLLDIMLLKRLQNSILVPNRLRAKPAWRWHLL